MSLLHDWATRAMGHLDGYNRDCPLLILLERLCLTCTLLKACFRMSMCKLCEKRMKYDIMSTLVINHSMIACDQNGVLVAVVEIDPQGTPILESTDLTYSLGIGVVMLERRILDMLETTKYVLRFCMVMFREPYSSAMACDQAERKALEPE